MKLLYILIGIIFQDLILIGSGLVGPDPDLATSCVSRVTGGEVMIFFSLPELGLCASLSPPPLFFFLGLCRLPHWLFKNEDPILERSGQSPELLLKSARRGCNRQPKGNRLPESRTPAPPPRRMVSTLLRRDCPPSLTERSPPRARRGRGAGHSSPPSPPGCLSDAQGCNSATNRTVNSDP